MHHNYILALRLGVSVAPIAQKHRITADELLAYLQQLFPCLDARVLARAAAIGSAPPSA